jgi:hypothetical protein
VFAARGQHETGERREELDLVGAPVAAQRPQDLPRVEAQDLLPEPLLYLSAYFERQRGACYYNRLAVSQKGAWEDWLLFFLSGVLTEARDASRRAGRLFDLRETYRERFQREAGSTCSPP